MAENVEYVLSLKDLFISKIKEADGAAKSLNTTMVGIAGIAAAGFGLIGGIGFLKSSADAFNEADKASAQLNATLTSTGFAAGRTKEQLDAQAESLMRMSTFDDDAITGAQSLLLTFTNIRGEILDKTTPAILDLATKMGGDLKGATMQVGKALQDPTHGMLALRKAGVSFSDTQQEVIKNLQATGDLAGAQSLMLAELNKEFGGSAQADANTYAGQMTILKHEFANVKEEIGGIVMRFVIQLKPAIEKTIELFRGTVQWLRQNKDLIYAVGVSVGILAGAWLAYQLPAMAAAASTFILEGAFWALSAAMTANPIGLIIVGIAALAGAFVYAYNKVGWFRGAVIGVWEVMKGFGNFIVTYFKSVGEILAGVFTLDADRIVAGTKGAIKAYYDLGMNVGANFQKGYSKGVNDLKKDELDAALSKKGPATAKSKFGMAPAGPAAKGTKTPSAANVTGQKVYTINISIDSLVKDFKVQTTNMTEGAGKVKDLVTQALLSAVNDSQIIAER